MAINKKPIAVTLEDVLAIDWIGATIEALAGMRLYNLCRFFFMRNYTCLRFTYRDLTRLHGVWDLFDKIYRQ